MQGLSRCGRPCVREKMKTVYKYLITAAFGAVLAFIVLLIKDVFHLSQTVDVMKALCDGFFISGVLIACFGGLVFASNGGVFDMITYGVKNLFWLFKKNPADRKYKDFYEYREAMKEKKRSYGYMVIVGLAYIAVSLIFLALYYNYLPE